MAPYDYFIDTPRSDKNTREVIGSKILFVEGLDECILLDRMLADLKADKTQLQIIQYGGRKNLETNLRLMLRANKFVDGEVSALAVFRDADQSFDKSYYDLKKAMKECGLPDAPLGGFTKAVGSLQINYGAFIFPDNARAGNLETLLLQAPVSEVKRDAAVDFVQTHANKKDQEDSKRVAQVYLAVQHELCRGAGQGGRDGYFDLTAEVLKDLWGYLRQLVAM